ncbi:hypothetical protein BIT18_0554, partial [Mycobacterium tuberculosis variant bovis]
MPDSDWLKPVSAGVASKVALSPRRRIVVAWCCSDVVECVMGGDGQITSAHKALRGV